MEEHSRQEVVYVNARCWTVGLPSSNLPLRPHHCLFPLQNVNVLMSLPSPNQNRATNFTDISRHLLFSLLPLHQSSGKCNLYLLCPLFHCSLNFLINCLQLPYSVKSNGYFPILILTDLFEIVELLAFPFLLDTCFAFGFYHSYLLATPFIPLHRLLFSTDQQ